MRVRTSEAMKWPCRSDRSDRATANVHFPCRRRKNARSYGPAVLTTRRQTFSRSQNHLGSGMSPRRDLANVAPCSNLSTLITPTLLVATILTRPLGRGFKRVEVLL